MSEPDPLSIINEVKTYRMTRRIAEGGMGAVYEAQQFGDQDGESSALRSRNRIHRP